MPVVAFESRLAGVMQESLFRHGGRPFVAPSMQEIPLENNPEIFAFGEKLLEGRIDLLICMTGVGTRYLIQILAGRYTEEKVLEALRKTTVLARGPKPVAVLREFQVPISMTVPEPNTWREVLEEIDFNPKSPGVSGRNVAIQEYGVSNEELVSELKSRHANVIQVPVYRWALPDDRGPLEEAVRGIIEGRFQAALITSQYQIRHLLRVAAEMGKEAELLPALRRLVMASIGPVATEAIESLGLEVDFEPSHPKMGHLIAELAREAQALWKEKTEGHRPLVELSAAPRPESEREKRVRESVFLRACRREPVPYVPVWLMRQAGRYMKEYRKIRRQVPFLELCKNKELAAEVTCMAVEKLNVDAAIIFSDILLIVEPMGFELQYVKDDGPMISGFAADFHKTPEADVDEALGYVYDAIRLTRSSLDPMIPLIGFSGAPFTLASYIIEGGASRLFGRTKSLMYRDPETWHALMGRITRLLIQFLNGQVRAGADALQVFDSWIGCLGPEDYEKFVQPHMKTLLEGIRGRVPVIHFGTGTGAMLPEIRSAGADVIGLDFRVRLAEAWKQLGPEVAVQGNLDPLVLFSSPAFIRERVKHLLDSVAGRSGYIFNLGHGILPQTPVEHAQLLVEAVHEMSQTSLPG